MRRKAWWILGVAALLLGAFLIAYPHIEIDTGSQLIVCGYTDEILWEYEKNQTYNECYAYNEKHDVSIYDYDQRQFLFFHVLIMDYVEGDMRATEFLLEEDYINHFLQNAVIEANPNGIDLAQLIGGREAVVGNTRYLGNDYTNAIYYTLDGRHEVLYVFFLEDLLVIQVGNSDEGPRFIAYK